MRSRSTRWIGVGIFALTAFAASSCGSATPVEPTPTLATDTLTGTVKVGGSDSKNFTVTYASNYSDASITVTALTLASTGAALDTTIGVAFGSPAFDGSCARSATYTATAARIGQEYVASGVFIAGVNYCIQVFDAGTLTGDTNYTLSLKHY